MTVQGRPVTVLALVVAMAAGCSTGAGPSASPRSGPSSTPSELGTTAPPVEPASPAASVGATTPSPRAATRSARPSPAPAPTGWALIDAAGPSAREDHTWTVADDDGAWLFGGRDGASVHGDLWRYDLGEDRWDAIAPVEPAPAARFGHTATWVEDVGLVVWSGQSGPSTFFDDLWAFDPSTGAWRELPARGPVPAARYGSCAALGPDGRLWVSHGFTQDDGRFGDTWTYDFGAGEWTDVTLDADAPAIRCLHDCLFTADGRFVIYAGQTTGVAAIGDLWARPVEGAWARGPQPEPPARQLYAITVRGPWAWLFGGGGVDGSRLGDLWRLDLTTLAWEPVPLSGAMPSPRSGATMVTDRAAGRLLLFGGLGDDGASAESWALELRH